MTQEMAQEIMSMWDDIEEENPDKSAAWMIAMTAERMGIEIDTVVEAVFTEIKTATATA